MVAQEGISTGADVVRSNSMPVKNFKGKKAAPFAKGGGRKKSSSKTARGHKKK